MIVIGGGSAALEAAISARQAGASSVVLLEKAPPHESGGNAQFSHVGFRFVHSGPDELREFLAEVPQEKYRRMQIPAYTRQNFLDDLNRVTQGRIDPVLAECLVDQSNAAVHWMKDIGVKWEPEKLTEVDGKLYLPGGHHIHPIGGGPGMLEQLRSIAFKAVGAEIRFESRVNAIHGNDRRVEGVRVSTPDGEYDLAARAVIVCSGGFQANAEMRARYLGPNADLMKVRGSKHNTGEVLNMLLALGVKSAGHWQGAHMSPIDGKAPDVETPAMSDGRGNSMNRYDYQFGITVNALGQRFYDEGEAKHAYTYAKTGRAVLQQPGGVAYQIYDQTGIDLFRHGRDYPATHVEAPTLEALARKIGIEPEPFLRTVEEFNAACRTDIAFMPGELDGKGTVGITPKKSNWAVPLTRGPFRAYPVTGGVT
ncbi:MAG: FAD-dependent tricarballylate dehydrogenase TcuA, partial [Hyphomicrobiaceae bacterium]|nr:FAD-dependent tricarballylate dehydrogenase TcuA [Hyphomicrobiaceae bacterium]